MGVIGLMFDFTLEGALVAIKARGLRSPDFPTDGLDYIGSERCLPRFPNESHADYKTRLLAAWDIWRQSGTQGGIELLFSLLGITIDIKTNAQWNWDGQTTNWSRFWLVVTDHPWVAGPPVGTLNPVGNGTTIGTTASPDEVRAVRNIVIDHKAAHDICPNIVIVLDEVAWAADLPDGTWGNIVNRNPTARYWVG